MQTDRQLRTVADLLVHVRFDNTERIRASVISMAIAFALAQRPVFHDLPEPNRAPTW